MDMPYPSPVLPRERGLFYGGAFHPARSGCRLDLIAPATGETLGHAEIAGAEDVDAAVASARAAFPAWAALRPAERADALRGFAALLRAHAAELALVDAVDGGNPVASACCMDLESDGPGERTQ